MVGKNKKPKIAILSIKNSYQHGGTRTLIKTAYEFCSQYFDPTIFTLSFDPKISTSLRRFDFNSSHKESVVDGMPWVEIGSRWAFWEPTHYAAPLDQWKKALSNYRYFFAVSATPLAAHPLALLNKRYPLWACTTYDEDRKQRAQNMKGLRFLIDRLAHPFMVQEEKNILEKAAHIWAMSIYSKKEFEKISDNINKHITICPQPILAPKYNGNKDKNLIIAVGRFSDPRKNIGMLLNTYKIIQQALPKASLHIIGKQPTNQQLKPFRSIINSCNITFSGSVERKQLEQYYAKAALSLVTSYQEGFGIACLEALAYGTPVVATRCGGVEDFVIPNKTGVLVDIDDHTSMASQAISLLKNNEMWAKFSHNGVNLVANNFSKQRVHSLFQQGLCITYPELEQHFYAIDQDQPSLTASLYENTRY